MRIQFGMKRHPYQPDFDAIACKLPDRHDLLATLRIAQPWLTARELLDTVTSFLAYWIPNTHYVPLASFDPRNDLALVVDYALEFINPKPVDH